ncbi:uncharacterized protein LOC9649646 [Selaginella moellendorffii]|uniref:uncharacterized protein LOC9649646 n=1 Tax=Selaginella moellendorffii TaxID=88036 RepID=UPI000D1C4E79|nr:uncharacterized protein LOC9649646 [Selaginella moellendorffii]|eukprot:XP_024540766.1 uncharacterized protein LOC9649646 [Selaginella moellendorffii]
MSAGVGIPGPWSLESQPISSGFLAVPGNRGARFDARVERSRHYDIPSSDSESDDDLDDIGDDFLDESGDFIADHGSGAGIESCGTNISSPIEICPKTESATRILRQKSRRCAAEQSREEAWERRRLIEELKSSSSEHSSKLIARSNSDCGPQQPSLHSDEDLGDCPRSRSLTEEDFEELRGCIDLGFRFNAEKEDPVLCNTLPALEVCYAANRQLQDLHSPSGSSDSCSSWQVASPGEELQQVKEKLKHWARAVACISRQSR